MKKNLLTVLSIVFVFGFAGAQKISNNDSIYVALQGIQKSLEEKNYTRIPNSDFDKALEIKLSEKVNAQVTDRIDTIRNIVFLVLAIIGGALLLGLRTMVNNSVSEQLKDKIKQVEDDMKEKINIFYYEFVKDDMRKELNLQKEELRKEMIGYRDEFRKEIDPVKQKAESIVVELNTAKRLLLDYNISKLKAESKREDIKKEDIKKNFELAKEYLTQAEELEDKKLVTLAMAELSTAAYYAKKDREIESIIEKYIDSTDTVINENVFINLASGMFYEYVSTRDKNIKDKAMKYINASLRKINDYGEALGLKLEFFMADYEENFGTDAKEKIKHEASVIINHILISEFSPNEAIGRFNRVKTNAIERKYIDMLYENFPDEMKKMEEKVKAPIQAVA
jgi:hypothetical protein